ncbi:hypothetical protein ZWY2020_051117 [Hordeum vulgare]|nr:hypothetical protein ZWY2020_051117 [Hordeum vulgare]
MPGLAAGEQDVVSLVRRVARALNRRISEEDAINSGIIAMRWSVIIIDYFSIPDLENVWLTSFSSCRLSLFDACRCAILFMMSSLYPCNQCWRSIRPPPPNNMKCGCDSMFFFCTFSVGKKSGKSILCRERG